jgi:hypothetical protein
VSCPVRLPRRNSGEACQNLPVELILLVRLPGRPALTETFSFEFCKLFVSRPFSPRPSLSNGGIRFDALKIGRKDLLPHNLPCFTPRHYWDGARTSPTHQNQQRGRVPWRWLHHIGRERQQPQPLVHKLQGPPSGRQRRPQD